VVRSGYVLAGFETLAAIMNNFLNNTKDRYFDNFTRKDISNFLSKTCSGFLHSYGQSFSNKKSYKNYNKLEANLYRKCRETRIFDDSKFISDSGGFQISIGKLTKKESYLLLQMYYEFLKDHHEVLDQAFVLDVPPGPNCNIFNDFNDIYQLNLESYLKAKNLPDEVRKKMIYIHHFRTPKLWEIYTKIMRDNDMFSSFEYHGTGGIVANIAGDMSIPCIIYVLPIIPLLNECKKYNRNYLNFHVLGGANFRDILFYELFRIHVLEQHKIDLNITYDSSGLFKGLMIGRFINVVDENIFKKIDIRSQKLDKRFKDNIRVVDKYQQEIDRLSKDYNFKSIGLNNVYDDNTGTFHEDVKVYTMLYVLNQFSEIQTFLREVVIDLYDKYKSNDIEEFTKSVVEVTKNLNSGKVTKKQKVKSYSIFKSLDMLTNLDEDYCQYIVNKFLSKDEFVNLDQNRRVLKI